MISYGVLTERARTAEPARYKAGANTSISGSEWGLRAAEARTSEGLSRAVFPGHGFEFHHGGFVSPTGADDGFPARREQVGITHQAQRPRSYTISVWLLEEFCLDAVDDRFSPLSD